MTLSDTHPTFQASITAIAARYDKPVETVYGWWREYCEDCRNFDQSPVLSEFESWNQPRLQAA